MNRIDVDQGARGIDGHPGICYPAEPQLVTVPWPVRNPCT